MMSLFIPIKVPQARENFLSNSTESDQCFVILVTNMNMNQVYNQGNGTKL